MTDSFQRSTIFLNLPGFADPVCLEETKLSSNFCTDNSSQLALNSLCTYKYKEHRNDIITVEPR